MTVTFASVLRTDRKSQCVWIVNVPIHSLPRSGFYFPPKKKGDTGMRRIVVFSTVALLSLSGAAIAAETGSMTKDANMGKHMMSSKDGMSSHKGAMKGGHAMKGTHDKAMTGKHKMESKTK
jgi:hypothetical protein